MNKQAVAVSTTRKIDGRALSASDKGSLSELKSGAVKKTLIASAQSLDKSPNHPDAETYMVAGIAVESHVGADIRSLRKSRGMTLIDLCDAVGRSVGWLSQVERGQTDPSIPDLKTIAALFKVPVSFFFRNADAPENERGWIVRAGSRAMMGSVEDGLKEELLSPDIGGEFEMIRSVFSPNAKREVMAPRDTQDGGYVISGELEMTIGDQVYLLCKGDSFQFNRQPYGWHNKSNEDAVLIWIISPPNY